MKTQSTWFGAIALLLLAGPPVPAAAQDAKAVEVIAKTREALGGKKLDALKTFSAQATMARNIGERQISSEIEMFLEMPAKFVRSQASRGMANMTLNTGFNGDKAIMPAGGSLSAAPGGGVFRIGPGGPMPSDAAKPTPEQLEQMNTASLRNARTEISRMMLGWFGMAHPSLQARYTYAGEAESPDGKAHVIDVTDGDGFAARLFIDQNNHLPLMVTYQARQPRMVTSGGPMVRRSAPAGGATGQPLPDEERKRLQAEAEKQIAAGLAEQPLSDFALFFDDWREVDGLTFPHAIRRAAGGETTEEWTFTKVKVNPKIDPAKFAVDAK